MMNNSIVSHEYHLKEVLAVEAGYPSTYTLKSQCEQDKEEYQ